MIHVVDTHPIVWYLEDSPRLSKAARTILDDPGALVIVPTIVLAELRYLTASGRVATPWSEVLAAIASDARFLMRDLDAEIVLMMSTNLEMHDAIICATAQYYRDVLKEDVQVITSDRRIRSSGLIETVW